MACSYLASRDSYKGHTKVARTVQQLPNGLFHNLNGENILNELCVTDFALREPLTEIL